MIAVVGSLLVLLVVLDLIDLRRRARQLAEGSRLRWPAVVFLSSVVVVYCGLEAAGSWLVPGAADILENCRRAIGNASSTAAANQPSPLALGSIAVVLFYLAGFWDYWVHRLFSHSRWFWFTHEYHHLPTRVCLLAPGILGRPFAAMPGALTLAATAATAYTLLLLLGLPPWDLRGLLPVLLVVAVILTASHSSYLRRVSWVHVCLRWGCITTPQEHLLHHAAELSGNFGNFTTLWDRAFGTYLDPQGVDLDGVRLGLNYDQDYLGALTAGRLKLPSSWRRRFQLSHTCQTDPAEGAA